MKTTEQGLFDIGFEKTTQTYLLFKNEHILELTHDFRFVNDDGFEYDHVLETIEEVKQLAYLLLDVKL